MLDTSIKSAIGAFQQGMSYSDKTEKKLTSEALFSDWRQTLRSLFPLTFTSQFSKPQRAYWEWVFSIKKDVRPRPYVLILSRGGGKTTNCEVTPILLGAENIRTYCWYIQETQSQADKRIANIAEKLESIYIAAKYPNMSERWIGKFGNVGGWRRSFVRTASNVVFEAIGLDGAARSSKVGDARPNVVIIDEVDGKFDTVRATQKKLDLLTHTLLPAADNNAVIIFVQNLIHQNSIASQLADHSNIEFLQDRIISGPHPALSNFESMKVYDDELGREKDIIAFGTPLWEGQNVKDCQNYINTYGLTSFKTECQHEVENLAGSIWSEINFQHCTYAEVPDILIGCVWCDPAVTNKETSACYAIQADGMDKDGNIYRFMSSEEKSTPLDTLKKALIWCVELGFNHFGIETDQGGDTWEVVFDTAWKELIADRNHPNIGDTTLKPTFHEAKAGEGYGSKAHRNSLMLAGYQTKVVIHVINETEEYHTLLENSLRRFLIQPPYDLGDAAFWGWDFLSNKRYNEKQADAR